MRSVRIALVLLASLAKAQEDVPEPSTEVPPPPPPPVVQEAPPPTPPTPPPPQEPVTTTTTTTTTAMSKEMRDRLDKEAAFENAHSKMHVGTRLANLQDVKEAITEGADINALQQDGWTPLMVAMISIQDGNIPTDQGVAVSKVLLEARADINIKDTRGRTALFFAARCKSKEALQLFKDAKQLTEVGHSMSALNRALVEEDADSIETLIAMGHHHEDPSAFDGANEDAVKKELHRVWHGKSERKADHLPTGFRNLVAKPAGGFHHMKEEEKPAPTRTAAPVGEL